MAYMRNPKNAIQLDPPGKMDQSDLIDIGVRIKGASDELQPETPILEADPAAVNNYSY